MFNQIVLASAAVCGICLCIPRSSLQTLREKRAIKLTWKKLMREKNLKNNLGEYYTIGDIKRITNGYKLRIITPIGFTDKKIRDLEEVLAHAYNSTILVDYNSGTDKEINILILD